MSYVVLDTETTSKYPSEAELLSVAIIDHAGTVLLNTLVRPERAKTWPEAQEIHGIAPKDVFHEATPGMGYVTRQVADLIRGREVVIYNASYDATILAKAFALGPPAAVHCAMLAFSEHEEVREWNSYHGNYRWQSLATAAAHVGHQWQGTAHGALADSFAARDVWAWCTDPAERARLDEAKAEQRAAKELAWHIGDVFGRQWKAEADAHNALNRAWERRYFPAMGVCERRDILPENLNAERSADVFCLEPLGTTARAWNRYGKLLKLPRYFRTAGGPPVPANLTSGEDLHLLPSAKMPPPAGLLVYSSKLNSLPHEWIDAKPLYKRRGLKLGVHYVPHLMGYDPWPAGHYTKTQLQRDLKLKAAQIEALRPAYLRVVRHGSRYENEYLLYPYTPPTDEKPS